MKKGRDVFLEKIYSIFILLILIVSTIFLIVMKVSLDKIISLNPSLYKECNLLMILTFIFIGIIIMLVLGMIYIIRRRVVRFSDSICDVIDKVISKDKNIIFEADTETLSSKLNNKLKRLMEILNNDRDEALKEKDKIKTLIADISHQIKTPIANINMYNETLIQRELTKDQQIMCLNNMKFQVSKLEWLVQALIKMSRLESNIISLNKTKGSISDTIANALSGIYLKIEDKNLDLTVNCSSDIKVYHDKKWTSEAIFNIIENAVKYTEANGTISIKVEQWELFTKIDIEDNGIGIDTEEINNIFKRFYRCQQVSDREGVGIGLYLANEIIIKQGGYIKVKSEKGNGSIFSVFIPN